MGSDTPVPVGQGRLPDAAAAAKDAPSSGVLRWGLVGCPGLSVIAIVGMVLFLRKAPQIMETLLGATERQVVAALAPDVPAADRDEFRREYAAFVAAAKVQKVKPDAIQALQKTIVAALKDDVVTAEELRGLTGQLRAIPKP